MILEITLSLVQIDLRLSGAVGQLFEQLWAYGKQVTSTQSLHLVHIAERGAHHLGLVAVLFVVVVDSAHALHARIVEQVELFLTLVLDIPVVDSAHKRRDQSHTSFSTRHSLTTPISPQLQITFNKSYLSE